MESYATIITATLWSRCYQLSQPSANSNNYNNITNNTNIVIKRQEREREREREREKKERRAFISVCQATLSTPQCPWYLYLCFFFLIRLCLFLLLFHFYFFCFFLSCCCLQLKSWLKIIALCLKLISAFIWISDWHLYRVTLGKWREHGNNEEKMERMYANR